MSRKNRFSKRKIELDPIYNSILVSSFINKLLLDGKKSKAQFIFYQSMKNVASILGQDPLDVLKKAIENSRPLVMVTSKRVGGATYQVPVDLSIEKGTTLALSFIVKSAKTRSGKTMILKLQNEIIDAYNNTGNSIKRKEEIHRMAEANKAFTTIKF